MALPTWEVEKEVWTEDEYFTFEQQSPERHEFVEGEVRAMAGGSNDHAGIALNIGGVLRQALIARGCRVRGSDLKVHTGSGVNTYPDLSVVCAPTTEYHRGRADTITNPALLVEVLSESTEAYDRGEKWDHYRTIASLVDYLLVSSEEPRVMLYTRDGERWLFREVAGLETSVELPSLGVSLSLAEVYALTTLGESQ